jgi:hypothetical protein
MPGPEIGAAGLILASSLARGTAARTWVVPGQVSGLAEFIPAGPRHRDQDRHAPDRPIPQRALPGPYPAVRGHLTEIVDDVFLPLVRPVPEGTPPAGPVF